MGHQIIRQPDGQFCVFDTDLGRIVAADATSIQAYLLTAGQAQRGAKRPDRPAQQELTYEEAVELQRQNDGNPRLVRAGLSAFRYDDHAYLVLYDSGGIGWSGLDIKLAHEFGQAAGGVVVKAPIVADYRRPKEDPS